MRRRVMRICVRGLAVLAGMALGTGAQEATAPEECSG
jgi:hypothetical protein